MDTYAQEFNDAVARAARLGLMVPAYRHEPERRWLDAKTVAQFPHVMRYILGKLLVKDVSEHCIDIHHDLVSGVSSWLGCRALFTIGWVDHHEAGELFRFDEKFVRNVLQEKLAGEKVLLHAWLTLPSMEIIDVTLLTTVGVWRGEPDMIEQLVLTHPERTPGMIYKPMLVGDDFLYQAGAIKSSRTFSSARLTQF